MYLAALDGLPFDVFVYLCHFLAPFDMLSVMQVLYLISLECEVL
jgi:hypothetical protein